MSQRRHLSPDGKARECKVRPGEACKIMLEGDIQAPHADFDNDADAQIWAEKMNAMLYGADTLSSVNKRASSIRKKSPASRNKVAVPTNYREFSDSINRMIPMPANSLIGEQPVKDSSRTGWDIFVGGRANAFYENEKSRWISTKEASAGVSALIREAKKAGELPSWVSVSVTVDKGSWNPGLLVRIGYKPEGRGAAQKFPEAWIGSQRLGGTPAARHLYNYVRHLARQYEVRRDNAQFDEWNNHNAGRVSFLGS